ncbi:MAG: class I SAM-dependent methyltransferase [Bacillota bacterium]|nr:class I SAM-dependent methyltransferase [Bacillota bacterium]
MIHKFDVNNRHKLDNEKRRMIMPPFETLEKLGFSKGMDIADIGCGIGYFTIPAAEIGGQGSKIYALDLSVEMLDEVDKRAVEHGISNIRTIKVDEYDLKLDNGTVEFALLSNVLHEIEEKGKYISEIHRLLKVGGKLAIVEWNKVKGESGPPVEHRISSEELTELISEGGFETEIKISIGQDYYGIVATKK